MGVCGYTDNANQILHSLGGSVHTDDKDLIFLTGPQKVFMGIWFF